MTATTSSTTDVLRLFDQLKSQFADQAGSAFAAERLKALQAFEKLGYPTAKHEAWRFTQLGAITQTVFEAGQASASTPVKKQIDAHQIEGTLARIVFVNGRYSKELSKLPASPKGWTLTTGAPALGNLVDVEADAFSALNTAFAVEGATLTIKKEASLSAPLHVLWIGEALTKPTMNSPRLLIQAEPHAQAQIIETFISTGVSTSWTNSVTEIRLNDSARLEHVKIVQESASGLHISTTAVAQERSSVFNSFAFLASGQLVRNNINVYLQGEGVECALNGLYLTRGKEHIDTHTWLEHQKPHGTSHEYYKGVLDDQSTGVFDGMVVVAKDSQKTDAVQSNKNLLLSDKALIHTQPELKIFANDVKCKHGATVGQIAPESLFYLRSRGIAEAEARKLLILAFASEMLASLSYEPLRSRLQDVLLKKYGSSGMEHRV